MERNPQKYPIRRVLVFNPIKRLVGIFHSCTSAANAFGVPAVNIHDACSGRTMSCKRLYFRFLYEDKIELEMSDDFGNMKLEDYDNLVGIERKYYPNREMTRVGMKYNKTTKETKKKKKKTKKS